jgi:acetyl-CoA C-acetyltransferase
VAQDGAQAVYYATALILSGHTDLVMVVGHCKESQGKSRNAVTHLSFDPFYTRPLGLDGVAAAALQAQAYLARSQLDERELARIVVRARRLAAKSPWQRELEAVSEDDVLASPLCADPLRELHCHPVTDGAIGLVLAAEERAGRLTDQPVWVTGVGNCMDSFFLGERDLHRSEALHRAAERAYRRAGIADPASAGFDVVELSDPYVHQQPMWLEGLGLCEEGGGGRLVADGGLDRLHVNLSGGTLAGCPLILGGLGRVAEAALQLSGKAGPGRQLPNARHALAHGVMGPAGQFHSVVILEAAA